MPTTAPTPNGKAQDRRLIPLPETVIDNSPWTEAEVEEFDRRVREKRERRAQAKACS